MRTPDLAHASTRRDDRRVFTVVFLSLLCVFAVTARWHLPYHIDPVTNAVTGWYWAETGSPIAVDHDPLTRPEFHGNLGWFVSSPRGTISQYPVGAALLPALAYLITPTTATAFNMSGTNRPEAGSVEVPVPPVWPATASSVVAAAAACAILAVVFRRLGPDAHQATVAGLFSGLATTTWAVASNMSWTHAPAMLMVALGMLFASRDRWLATGLAFGGAILIRPHLAAIAAILAIVVAVKERRWRPILLTGAGSAGGLAALLAFNYWVWGRLTISGGYGTSFAENLVSSDLMWFLGNLLGAIVDIRHGLLLWAPFLLIAIPAAFIIRREAPTWTTGAALGGLLYLLIQLRANRFSGGDGHFAYRYPLEALIAAAPLLYVGYQQWTRSRPTLHRVFIGLGVIAVAGMAVGAVVT